MRTTTSANVSEKRAVWREPTMWLIFGLPAAAVAASVALIVSAVRSGGDDGVIDQVSHTAQIQVADLGADERAGQLGLSALLQANAGSVELVPVSGNFDLTATLQLHVAHPARAEEDLHVALLPATHGWHGQLATDADNDWIIRLDAADGSWRLRGRLLRGQQAVLLTPALPGH
jgi:hypothetical protein